LTDLQPSPVPDIEELEARFQRSFSTGTPEGLEVIGFGEVSSVVRWDGPSGPVAAKRLPNYPTTDARRNHRELMAGYIDVLRERGVAVLPTEFQELDAADGTRVLYTIQPLVSAECLAVDVLRESSRRDGEELLREIFSRTAAVVGDPRYGLDVQLSNWVIVAGELGFLDISTPFMRDETTGISRLDTSIFSASLPWLLRWPVERFMAGGIVAEYFDLRTAVINAIANFRKEGLDEWMQSAMDAVNVHLDEPINLEEVDRYYNRDRRMWAFLQWLRRADRWWQLRVRRRPYPVLLPGRIDR
jgi:hypothetical protein